MHCLRSWKVTEVSRAIVAVELLVVAISEAMTVSAGGAVVVDTQPLGRAAVLDLANVVVVVGRSAMIAVAVLSL